MTEGITEGNLDTHTDTQAGEAGDAVLAVGESDADKAAIAAAERGIDPNETAAAKAAAADDQLLAGKYKDENALNKGVTELLKMQYPGMSVADIYKGIETGKLVPSSTASGDDQSGDKGTSGDSKTDEGITPDGEKDPTSELDPLDPVALTLERDNNNGQLTKETREKLLTEYKIPEGTLDTYLEGLNALEEKFVGQVYELTGGEEKYNGMLDWMNANMEDAELDAFNTELATQDITKVKLAVEGMSARYKAVVGNNPNLIRPHGSDTTNVASGAYASKAQWLQDMAKPEYKTDPAFRETVIQKLSKSKF